MKRLILAVILAIGFTSAANATTASQSGPIINASYQGGTTQYSWSFTITDLPSNLLTAMPAIFTQISSTATTDSAMISAAQTAITAKVTSAQSAAPAQYVTVTVQRSILDSSPTYSVVTIW